MLIYKLLLTLMILTLPAFSYSQEICSNGIDDDNDNLIDWQDTVNCSCGYGPAETIYYVPNVFSPDGDEYNNEFNPVFTCGFDVFSYELKVYSNRGDILFASKNYQIGWDGTTRGVPVQLGVYAWTIEYKTSYSDEAKVLRGHVGIMR